MNREIHELINMKARKEELEVELGTSHVDIRHLSSQQRHHIEEDMQREFDPVVILERVNLKIRRDENAIARRH
jgi:hypothetical protein